MQLLYPLPSVALISQAAASFPLYPSPVGRRTHGRHPDVLARVIRVKLGAWLARGATSPIASDSPVHRGASLLFRRDPSMLTRRISEERRGSNA